LQAKIAKRGRKLIDYDVARHNFDTMNAKKVDQVKLSRVGLILLSADLLCTHLIVSLALSQVSAWL